MTLALFESITSLSPGDWAWFGLASAVIFGLLGGKLLRDIRGWLSPRPPTPPAG